MQEVSVTDNHGAEARNSMFDEDIGKLLFAGFEGTHFTPDSHAGKLIREHHVHCFVLKKRNFVNGNQFKQLLDDMQKYAYSLHFQTPLVLSADYDMYEYCAQNIDTLTRFPVPLAIAATGKIQIVYNIGKAIALELRSLGINVVQGPVLDICSNILGDVVGMNSKGATDNEVVRYSIAMGCGFKAGGLLTIGEHFPLLERFVYNETSESLMILDEFDQIEKKQSHGLKTVMESNIIDSMKVTVASASNALSEDVVCCLNPKIVDGLLRNNLKFDKLVITECLETQEIFTDYGIGQAAVFAIVYAHCDMVTVCHSYKYQMEVLEYLTMSFENNNSHAIRITALRRIDAFLNKLSWFNEKYTLDDQTIIAHRELADETYRRSICLVKDSTNLIPVDRYLKRTEGDLMFLNLVKDQIDDERHNKIILLTPEIDDKYSFLKSILVQHGSAQNCRIVHAAYSVRGLPSFIVEDLPQCVFAIFVLSDIATYTYQMDLLKEVSAILLQNNKNLIVVSVSSPYLFMSGNHAIASTFLCTYDCTYSSLKYLGEVIFGEIKATGVVPGVQTKHSTREDLMNSFHKTSEGSAWKFDFLLNRTTINQDKMLMSDNSEYDQSIYPTEFAELLALDESIINHSSETKLEYSTFLNDVYDTRKIIVNSNDEKNPKNLISAHIPEDEGTEKTHRSNGIVEDNNPIAHGARTNITFSYPQSKSRVGSDKSADPVRMLDNMSGIKAVSSKPWVTESVDATRDMSVYLLVQSSTIDDTYYPLSMELVRNIWEFGEKYQTSNKTFIVRNSSTGVIYGEVTVVANEFDKCGRIIYMVVSKSKRRQGVGEVLHRRAIQYLTIEKNCTTVALGCVFPFFNYLSPKVLNEMDTIWSFMKTKDVSKVDMNESTMQLVGFYKSMGWDYTRFSKGVSQQARKCIMHLRMQDWRIPGFTSSISGIPSNDSYQLMNFLKQENVQFVVSSDTEPAFKITEYMLQTQQLTDDEEVLFTDMYYKTKFFIEKDKKLALKDNKRRTTLLIYVLINNVVSGACIIYTTNSYLTYFYPFLNTLKKDVTDVVAGITGLFVGNIPKDISTIGDSTVANVGSATIQYSTRSTPIMKYVNCVADTHLSSDQIHMTKLGLISAAVNVIRDLGVTETVLHNVNEDMLPDLANCGFNEHIAYYACYGKKKAFEWVV